MGWYLCPRDRPAGHPHHQILKRVKIAVLKEGAAHESRVAATPESVRKFIGLGATVAVETMAGAGASLSDADFEGAGASIGPRADIVKDADIVLCVQGPDPASLAGARQNALLVGALNPFVERGRIDAYAAACLDAM